MDLMLVVQFAGEGARALAADEYNPSPQYVQSIEKLLKHLGMPIPQRLTPVWKSGFVRGIYKVSTDTTSRETVYRALDVGLSLARKSYSLLEKYSVRFIKVVDPKTHIPYLVSGNAPRVSLVDRMREFHGHQKERNTTSHYKRHLYRNDGDSTLSVADASHAGPSNHRVPSGIDAAIDELLANSQSANGQATNEISIKPDPDSHSAEISLNPIYIHQGSPELSGKAKHSSQAEHDTELHLANTALWDTRRELAKLQLKEQAMVARIRELGGSKSVTELSEIDRNSLRHVLDLQENTISELKADLRDARAINDNLQQHYESECARRKSLEQLLEDITLQKNGFSLVPAMLDAMERLSRLTADILEVVHTE